MARYERLATLDTVSRKDEVDYDAESQDSREPHEHLQPTSKPAILPGWLAGKRPSGRFLVYLSIALNVLFVTVTLRSHFSPRDPQWRLPARPYSESFIRMSLYLCLLTTVPSSSCCRECHVRGTTVPSFCAGIQISWRAF